MFIKPLNLLSTQPRISEAMPPDDLDDLFASFGFFFSCACLLVRGIDCAERLIVGNMWGKGFKGLAGWVCDYKRSCLYTVLALIWIKVSKIATRDGRWRTAGWV
jgi:hypothetical protein